jgi:hypothetical protein
MWRSMAGHPDLPAPLDDVEEVLRTLENVGHSCGPRVGIMTQSLLPASSLATGSFNGFHVKSKFLSAPRINFSMQSTQGQGQGLRAMSMGS